ncbi:MAG: PQQ-dependent sugar dehydrogenase, partial [Geminicoccaceae bacterium]
FLGALGSGALVRISIAQEGEKYRVTGIENWFARSRHDPVLGRIRDVVEGPDGHLYFLTSNRDGRGDPRPGDDHIYRLERVE